MHRMAMLDFINRDILAECQVPDPVATWFQDHSMCRQISSSISHFSSNMVWLICNAIQSVMECDEELKNLLGAMIEEHPGYSTHEERNHILNKLMRSKGDTGLAALNGPLQSLSIGSFIEILFLRRYFNVLKEIQPFVSDLLQAGDEATVTQMPFASSNNLNECSNGLVELHNIDDPFSSPSKNIRNNEIYQSELCPRILDFPRPNVQREKCTVSLFMVHTQKDLLLSKKLQNMLQDQHGCYVKLLDDVRHLVVVNQGKAIMQELSRKKVNYILFLITRTIMEYLCRNNHQQNQNEVQFIRNIFHHISKEYYSNSSHNFRIRSVIHDDIKIQSLSSDLRLHPVFSDPFPIYHGIPDLVKYMVNLKEEMPNFFST